MIEQRDERQFNETHYQVAMEAAGIGMWDWDLLENKQIWSKECKAILGVPPEAEENYPSFLSLIHPEDRERVQQQLNETHQSQVPHNIVYRIIWPDGSMHWIADRGRFLYDEDGNAIRLTGVVIDVTAQKQAEEALHSTNQRLEEQQAFWQTLLHQAPAGIVIAEAPGGKIVNYNEEAMRMLGLPSLACESFAEYTRFGLLHLDGTPYQVEEYAIARALRTGEVVKQEEMLHRSHDDRLVYLAVSAAPIYDANGRLLAGIATFHDVSEQYELERQKDEFTCLASHELRTPLTSLKGNLQFIQRRLARHLKGQADGALSSQEHALFEQLLSWCERALRQTGVEERLVNDLLDAASLRAEEFRVVLVARDLRQVVYQTIEDLQTVAPPNLLVLDASVLPEMPVSIDAVRIGQVIANYVTNALPYASEQEPVVVGATLQGDQVCVWVQDSGPGLSVEEQQTIWKRFSPVPGFSGYRGMTCGGLGLGLYVCQRLIQLHGGTTGVDSAPGSGSRFWFQLPLLTTSDPDKP